MDPDVTLAVLRELVERTAHFSDICEQDEYTDTGDAWELLNAWAVHFDAMDAWLSRGGFPPRQWAGMAKG